MINLSAMVAFHARRTPEQTAISYLGQQITYADLQERIHSAAALLDSHGVGRGQVVAVVMKNSSAFLEIALAASHLGAVFLPVNYRLSADEVAYILEDSGATMVLFDEEFRASVATSGCPRKVVLDAAAQADVRSLGPVGSPPPRSDCAPGELFRLMYTSGTTDRPKGVMHTYENFYWKSMEHVITLGLSADSRLLVVGPLYHVGAFDLPGVAVLWMGGLLSVHREFQPEAALAAIQSERLNGAWLAPVMLGEMLRLPGRDDYDVQTLQWCIGGGERTPESRIREFSSYFTRGRYIDAYGLTESCSGDTFMEAGREIEKIGSVGRPGPHTELRISDDNGVFLASGVDGEICLRGPKISRGYWNDPAKTAASRFGEWFRTGDVGYLDDEGFLFLTDRKKDMIISGGENIASSEVERVVSTLSAVREVAVVGCPDARWGEVPVACVTLEPGATLDYPELKRHCGEHLAGFKVPKALHVYPELPRNPSGKVLKRILRDALLEQRSD